MSTTNSTSTFSGSPSFPGSAEVTVSLTESGDNPPQQQVVVQPQPEVVQKPKNQLYEQIPVLSFPPVKKPLVVEQQVSPQLDQKASPVQTSAQTETSPTSPNPQSPAGPSPRVELLTQPSPQKKPVVKPHPFGTAFFDNTTVTAFDLMPQEMVRKLPKAYLT